MSTESIQIRLNPEISNWRTDKKPDKELMADIKEKGQVEAITARRLPDGSLEIISGNRRYAALKELNVKQEDMKITILENVGEEDAILMALSGNRYRKDFTAVEEARAFNTLRKTMKWTIEKIAKKVRQILEVFSFLG